MTKAFIYCRVAAAQGDEKINQQEQFCREYAKQKGYAVAGVFKDNGVSGLEIERPGLSRLLKSLETGDVVIAQNLQRLARAPLIFHQISAIVKDKECDIDLTKKLH